MPYILLVIVSSFASVMSMTESISLTKTWVVSIVKHTSTKASINSNLLRFVVVGFIDCRISLVCKLVSPVVFGLIASVSSVVFSLCFIAVCCWWFVDGRFGMLCLLWLRSFCLGYCIGVCRLYKSMCLYVCLW